MRNNSAYRVSILKHNPSCLMVILEVDGSNKRDGNIHFCKRRMKRQRTVRNAADDMGTIRNVQRRL